MKKTYMLVICILIMGFIIGCGNSGENNDSGQKHDSKFVQYELNQKIELEGIEFTFTEANTSFDFIPSKAKAPYTYSEGTESKHFVHITGKIKNVGTQSLDVGYGSYLKAIIDEKYEYDFGMAFEEPDGSNFQYGTQISPFEEVPIRLFCSVPDELVGQFSSIRYQWGYDVEVAKDIDNASLIYSGVYGFDDCKELVEIIVKRDQFSGDIEAGGEQATEEVSEEEKTYQLALLAEEKGHCVGARLLFEKIIEYKDSKEHYNSLNTLITKYNGTYHGQLYNSSLKAYVHIWDGQVILQFENDNMLMDGYELFVYGQQENGNPILAIGHKQSHWWERGSEGSYEGKNSWAILEQKDGSYMIMACEGNTKDTWNGAYKKTSNSVSVEFD